MGYKGECNAYAYPDGITPRVEYFDKYLDIDPAPSGAINSDTCFGAESGVTVGRDPQHTCVPGLIGSAYGCPACGIGPVGVRITNQLMAGSRPEEVR